MIKTVLNIHVQRQNFFLYLPKCKFTLNLSGTYTIVLTANSRMDTDRYVIREYDRENASRMSSYGSPDSAGSTTLSYESEEREYVNRYLANRDKNKRVPNATYEVNFLLVALNYVFAHIPNNVMLKAIQKICYDVC